MKYNLKFLNHFSVGINSQYWTPNYNLANLMFKFFFFFWAFPKTIFNNDNNNKRAFFKFYLWSLKLNQVCGRKRKVRQNEAIHSNYLKCMFVRLARLLGPTPRLEWVMRRKLCLVFMGSSRKEMRSRGPLLCSNVKWPAKSSVVRLASPPGNEAQMGQIFNIKASINTINQSK